MIELYNEVENKEIKLKYRIRFEYLICLIPGIGKLFGLLVACFSGHIKYYIYYMLLSVFIYLTGGSLVYLITFLPLGVFSTILSYIVIVLFWLIMPLYVLYQYMFFVDELVLLKYTQKGYAKLDNVEEEICIPFIFKWWQ